MGRLEGDPGVLEEVPTALGRKYGLRIRSTEVRAMPAFS